jgi:hypothetical protein
MNFLNKLLGKKKHTQVFDDMPTPISFFTDCFMKEKGYMGDEYSFEYLYKAEKASLLLFFEKETLRLSILTKAMLHDRIGIEKITNNGKFIYNVFFELCMYDFATLKNELQKINKQDDNILGAIRDTIYWTFAHQNLHQTYYKSYSELENDKIKFYNDFVKEYDFTKAAIMEAADDIYFKILEKPCCPFLLSLDFFDNMNATKMTEKAKFAALVINGQRELITNATRLFSSIKKPAV